MNETDTGNDHELTRGKDHDLTLTIGSLLVAIVLGWGAVTFRNVMVTYSNSSYSPSNKFPLYSGWSFTFASFLWTLAWLALGFLLGFLFGVPKVISQAPAVVSALPAQPVKLISPPRLRVNTNLEEISDWLTKILVGATLTQLFKIPGAIDRIAKYMALGDLSQTAIGFNAAILLYYGTLGFLFGYIMTRMFFSRAFDH